MLHSSSTRKRCSRMLELFFVFFFLASCRFLFQPSGTRKLSVKMCVTANFLSVSVLIFVSVTDGAADSGELDLSGIDDSEIELVCTC